MDSVAQAQEWRRLADQCSDLTAYGIQPRYPMGFVLAIAPELTPKE
jgi:hypothetical protein